MIEIMIYLLLLILLFTITIVFIAMLYGLDKRVSELEKKILRIETILEERKV